MLIYFYLVNHNATSDSAVIEAVGLLESKAAFPSNLCLSSSVFIPKAVKLTVS